MSPIEFVFGLLFCPFCSNRRPLGTARSTWQMVCLSCSSNKNMANWKQMVVYVPWKLHSIWHDSHLSIGNGSWSRQLWAISSDHTHSRPQYHNRQDLPARHWERACRTVSRQNRSSVCPHPAGVGLFWQWEAYHTSPMPFKIGSNALPRSLLMNLEPSLMFALSN